MNVLAIMAALALPAVDYGWQPAADGTGIEYIVQVEPSLVAALERGEPLVSEIPAGLPPVRKIIVLVGNQQLPKILPPGANVPPLQIEPKDGFLKGGINAPGGDGDWRGQGNPVGIGNQPGGIGNPVGAGNQQGSTAPPKLAPPTEWKSLAAAQQQEAELERQQGLLPQPPSFDDPGARPGVALGGDTPPEAGFSSQPAIQIPPANQNNPPFTIPGNDWPPKQPNNGGVNAPPPLTIPQDRTADAQQPNWPAAGGNNNGNGNLQPIPAGGNGGLFQPLPDFNRGAGTPDNGGGTNFGSPKFTAGSPGSSLAENMPPPQIRGQDEEVNEADKPWFMFTVTAMLLFASLGLNGYLFLVARSIYQRYRDLAADMRGAAY